MQKSKIRLIFVKKYSPSRVTPDQLFNVSFNTGCTMGTIQDVVKMTGDATKNA